MSTDFATAYDGPRDELVTFRLRDDLALVTARYTYLVYASDITESDEFIFHEDTSYVF